MLCKKACLGKQVFYQSQKNYATPVSFHPFGYKFSLHSLPSQKIMSLSPLFHVLTLKFDKLNLKISINIHTVSQGSLQRQPYLEWNENLARRFIKQIDIHNENYKHWW